MTKRFQVFVSSTYADLKDERARVFQALMQMDCIPAGMELFPAMDEEQLAFIRRIIDDCDYYVLIIGGRYGSMTTEGISYTEMEYDYAVERGIPVLAFLHSDIGELKAKNTEADPEVRNKLMAFRDKVKAGRLVKFWRTADELKSEVVLSLSQTTKTYPGVGWVRGNTAASEELLSELNNVRKEFAELSKKHNALKAETTPLVPNLAPVDQKVILALTTRSGSRSYGYEATWISLFGLIAPRLVGGKVDAVVQYQLGLLIGEVSGRGPSKLEDLSFDGVKVQFMALGLVTVQLASTTDGGSAVFWNLTRKGQQTMLVSRAARATSTDSQDESPGRA